MYVKIISHCYDLIYIIILRAVTDIIKYYIASRLVPLHVNLINVFILPEIG